MFHKKAPEKWLKLGLRDVCLKKKIKLKTKILIMNVSLFIYSLLKKFLMRVQF